MILPMHRLAAVPPGAVDHREVDATSGGRRSRFATSAGR
jgi:hypothetical protein